MSTPPRGLMSGRRDDTAFPLPYPRTAAMAATDTPIARDGPIRAYHLSNGACQLPKPARRTERKRMIRACRQLPDAGKYSTI